MQQIAIETNNLNQPSMSPLELARLDFQLFKSLHQLGTSQERITAVLNLKPGQFEYLQGLRAL